MRLKSLKLSGFKSFVDTAVFEFPSNLVGIIGPNGCGKSNSIDAVRWVMGERSAKHLRGESMSDVIFNGAKTRKPIGKASVEMLFDNSQGKVKGQYSAYNEILVKREVTRDGQSNYFLNSTKVRRRDVMDLFLGTGLGPRSYAIIEQGMISRFIEAKPEEIRNMIEEAAGVSKYKERRRETANRIKHTRENLERITDLSNEIGTQLGRLDRQAKAAEKYKSYKIEQKLLKAQILSINWQQQNNLVRKWQQEIATHNLSVEEKKSLLQSASAKVEKIQLQQIEDNDILSTVQSKFYQARSDLTELEQKSEHLHEQEQQISSDLTDMDSYHGDSSEILKDDVSQLEVLTALLADKESKLLLLQTTEKTKSKARDVAEQKWNEWQKQNREINLKATEFEKIATKENMQIRQLESLQLQLNKRLLMLNNEQKQLPVKNESDSTLLTNFVQEKQKLDSLRSKQLAYRDKVQISRSNVNKSVKALAEKKQLFQESKGKLVSLETIQKNSLSKSDNKNWLKQYGLTDAKRLAEVINIDSGWELAVEVVLENFLEAICLNSTVDADIVKDSEADVSLLFNDNVTNDIETINPKLSSVVSSDYSIDDQIANVYIAENSAEAESIRDNLKPGESVVTKSGVWYGKSWLRVLVKSDNNQNVLERENDIRVLRITCEQLADEITNSEQQIEALEIIYNQFEQEQEDLQTSFNDKQSLVSQLQSEQSAQIAKNEQISKRRIRIEEELIEIQTQLNAAENEIVTANKTYKDAVESLNEWVDKRKLNDTNRLVVLESFEAAQLEVKNCQDELRNLSIEVESTKSQINSLKKQIERIELQISTETKRKELLQQRLNEIKLQQPELSTKIKFLVDEQIVNEQKLNEAKQKLMDTEFNYREQQKIIKKLEQDLSEVQGFLEKSKIKSQESVVRATTLAEQLDATDFLAEDLLKDMSIDGEPKVEIYEQNAIKVESKIQRLGAINLAAIDEFRQESDRKTHIDQQKTDLNEALSTLEEAINKIDKETRGRFKETFDKINSGVQRLFPELFGGGNAHLELTDPNDILNTGVTIMAQPPGKRNSTIHLLSGGEKALTAVSMVFAIFDLNPAPFCMLDEVDAPLDDANVDRFCAMVKKMSEKVQFIFITHNKITMELSNQLTGVTMHEAGVSRTVAVDVQAAADMVGE